MRAFSGNKNIFFAKMVKPYQISPIGQTYQLTKSSMVHMFRAFLCLEVGGEGEGEVGGRGGGGTRICVYL